MEQYIEIMAIVITAWIAICVTIHTTRYRSLEEGLRVTFTGKSSPEAREAMLARDDEQI